MFVLQWLAVSVWNVIVFFTGVIVLIALAVVGLVLYWKYRGKTVTFTVGKKQKPMDDDYVTVDENKPK